MIQIKPINYNSPPAGVQDWQVVLKKRRLENQNWLEDYAVFFALRKHFKGSSWCDWPAGLAQKQRLFGYLGGTVSARSVHWQLIRLAMSSVADLAVIPMQDVLGLGCEARMNRPGTVRGNWRWRIEPGSLNHRLAAKLAKITGIFGRI